MKYHWTLTFAFLNQVSSAEQAFGSHPHSLGIIVVRDLPLQYITYRERLLKYAYKFAKLDETVREKYADPGSRYR